MPVGCAFLIDAAHAPWFPAAAMHYMVGPVLPKDLRFGGPIPDPNAMLLIRAHQKHLGVVLSCKFGDMDTIQHKLDQARTAYQRLRNVLRNRSI